MLAFKVLLNIALLHSFYCFHSSPVLWLILQVAAAKYDYKELYSDRFLHYCSYFYFF